VGLFKKAIFGVVAFVVIIVGLTYFTTRGASKVADEFIGYVQAVDSDSAFNLMSVEGKNSGTKEQFDKLIDRIGPILNGEVSKNGVGISAGSGQDTVSTINYKIPGSDGVTYIVEMKLVKENDTWKVLSIKSNPESSVNNNQ